MQRYAIESIPARVYEGCCTRFTILVLSATCNSPALKRWAVLVCGGRELARGRRIPKRPERPSGRGLLHGCPDPRGRQEMPQAQRRGISSILTSSSRQTAAHRHPLWTYRTPHPVRQGPISGNGAPQPPAQRTKAASRCGCLTKSVIVDFIQGHLDRCHFRRTFFDLFWLTVLIQSFFI